MQGIFDSLHLHLCCACHGVTGRRYWAAGKGVERGKGAGRPGGNEVGGSGPRVTSTFPFLLFLFTIEEFQFALTTAGQSAIPAILQAPPRCASLFFLRPMPVLGL